MMSRSRPISITRAFALLLLACALNPLNGAAQPARGLSARDEAFLEDLGRRSFRFFWEHGDPRTGLVLDRAHTDGTPPGPDHPSHNIASSASTGFALTALCIAHARGWITPGEARERVRATLRFFAEGAPQERGWFPHWMDLRTGERRWQSEFSSIDTALFLGGVLTARGYFRNDPEIVRLATRIYERIDFRWMLNNHPALLSHGWKPETGFLKPRWDTYSEHLMLDLLAIGSPTHPVSTRSWRAWRRDYITYAGYTYITGGPLFIHQYSHAWVDFRGRREDRQPRTDFFLNSVAATRAHRLFCLSLAKEFPGYTETVWGITASDSEKGYVAWGGPPRDPAIDGTVVPAAAGGSLMFTPDITLAALRAMREKYGERIYGRYGFTDAFNPNTNWVGPDVIGIDVGITLLSAENLRTGNVWRWFMRNREIGRALELVGLRKYKASTRARKANAAKARTAASPVRGGITVARGVSPGST